MNCFVPGVPAGLLFLLFVGVGGAFWEEGEKLLTKESILTREAICMIIGR